MAEESQPYISELVRRVERLQNAYGLYAGVQFRAIIQHRPDRTDVSWVHMLGAMSYSRQAVKEERWELGTLFSGLALLKGELPVDKVGQVLAPILKLGLYETYPGRPFPDLRRKRVTMASPDASPCSLGPAEEVSRKDFESKFGEPHPGIVYFVDSHLQVVNEMRLSPGTLAELGYTSAEHFLWHSVLNPHGTAPWSPNLQRSGLYVVLPSYHGQIHSVILEGAQVKVKIDTGVGVPLGDFDVTLTGWASDGRVLPPQHRFKLDENEVVFSFVTPPSSVKARLVWNRGTNDSERFVDEKHGEYAELVLYPRLAAYDQFDPGLKLLEDFLDGKGKNQSVDFEWAVATLLSIAGFQVEWLGYLHGTGKKEVDIVAFVPDSTQVFLVECTLARGDIQRRINSIVESAQDFAPLLKGAMIGKAIATTLRSGSVNPSDSQDAGHLGVSLLTQETLKEFLKLVRSAVPLDGLVKRFLTPTPAP